MKAQLTKSNRHEVCLKRALAIAGNEPVSYVEVPSQLPPKFYSFEACREFWAWLQWATGDYDYRCFTAEEWIEYPDELEAGGWLPDDISEVIDRGMALFAAGAKSIAQVRWGDHEDLLPDSDGRQQLWRHAHRDLHCGYLLTRSDAQKIIEQKPDAVALSHHLRLEVIELLRTHLEE